MMKKSSALYRPERRTKKKAHTTLTGITKFKKQIKKLSNKADNAIDYSDIPELHFDQLGKPVVGKFYRPIKKQISIRIDADILDWFKREGKKYQSLINQACREFMEHHRKLPR